jgi:hypothetical protein
VACLQQFYAKQMDLPFHLLSHKQFYLAPFDSVGALQPRELKTWPKQIDFFIAKTEVTEL